MDDIVLESLNALVPGGVRRGQMRRGVRTVRWVEAGAGSPAVVFEAGGAEPGSLAWTGVLPAVAELTRVVAYDRAGIGASDPASKLTVGDEIADVRALLDESGGGPCVVVGHSWGGLLVYLAAIGRPELVAGMVLVDPTHEEVVASAPWPLRRALAAPGYVFLVLHALGLLPRAVRRQYQPFARRVTEEPRLQGLLLDAYVSCFTKRSQVLMLRTETRLGGMSGVAHIRQLREGSPAPNVPIVVLSATRGLPANIRDRWTKLQAGLCGADPGSEHIVAHDTGHAIHQERPELVTTAIIRLLDHVRRRGVGG